MTTSAAGVSSGSFWKPLTPFLQRAHPTVITGYCSLVTFLCYFSLYGLKKPFTAASYDEYEWLAGIQLKTALALSQLAGYIFAKFVGIKIVFEVDREGPARAFYLIGLAVMALVGWIIHALVPIQWKVIGVFLTGIPMGLVWGIAITYVEGRSGTDFIIAILSSAYIVASGVVKDVGLGRII